MAESGVVGKTAGKKPGASLAACPIVCAGAGCRVEYTETAARRRVLTDKVVRRVHNLQLAAAWSAWLDLVGEGRPCSGTSVTWLGALW